MARLELSFTPASRLASLKGRVGYYLLIVVIFNLSYPLAEGGSALQAYAYTFLYCMMLGFGVYIAAETRFRFRWSAALALLVALLSVPWVLYPNNFAVGMATYVALFAMHLFILAALSEFMFSAQTVTKAVLAAAITAYLLIGDAFIPLYMALDLLTRLSTHAPAFQIAAQPDAVVSWPQMAYFSYITLSTTGFGDVLPVTSWARAIVAAEGNIGVLSIALVIGRLVGLYSRPRAASEPL